MLKLAEWRRVRNITSEKMAEILGIHVNTYRRWELHPDRISVGQSYRIAEILGVPYSDIIFLP